MSYNLCVRVKAIRNVLSTLCGKAKACLAGKNYGNHVVFQVSLNFPLFLFRPVQNSKTACVILICFFNKMVFRAVWSSSSRVTRICCLISEKSIVRIRQNLVRSFVIGAHDGFTK